jgi:hypothetical protein
LDGVCRAGFDDRRTLPGKILYTQQIQVSPGGKILTMTVHIPGRDKPESMVFNRE